MDTKYVMMVDVRSRVFSDPETLSRHEKYGELLAIRSDNQIKLVILTLQNSHKTPIVSIRQSFETLIIPTSVINLLSSLKYLSTALKKYKVESLICGDPWESYLLARFLRRSFFHESKIQVQLHGDFASPKWGNNSKKSRLRKRLLTLKSNRISQIRLTSQEQFLSLSEVYKFNPEKVRIIPVPLNLPTERPSQIDPINPTFGLIGRIHKERGLDTFAEFAKTFYNYDNTTKFVIIGNGPQKVEFQSTLLSSIPADSVLFLGELSGKEFHEGFSSIDVLCSFAPTESYGRVAREALAMGKPILAKHSAGLNQLAMEGGKEFIQFLPNEPTSETFIQKGLAALRINIPESYFEICKSISENSVDQLITSWIEMVPLEK